jgi:hypothetical protein
MSSKTWSCVREALLQHPRTRLPLCVLVLACVLVLVLHRSSGVPQTCSPGCGSKDSLLQVKPVENGGNVSDIIYPHELMSMLFRKYRDPWEVHFGAECDKLEVFWKGFLQTEHGEEAARSVPALQGKSPKQLNHCLPLIVHGDGVPVTHKKSAVFVQWGSLLGPQSTDLAVHWGG